MFHRIEFIGPAAMFVRGRSLRTCDADKLKSPWKEGNKLLRECSSMCGKI